MRLKHPFLLLGAAAVVVAGLALPAQAASTGGVKGVVALDGVPVKGLKVYLQQSQDDGDYYEPIKVDTTNSKGAYSFSGFPVGEAYGYTVLVTDSTHRVVKARRSFADRAGRAVTRNVTVKKAARLSGRITRQDGGTLSKVRVLLDGPDDEIGTPDTTVLSYDDEIVPAGDGTFVARGLPAGSYDIRFTDGTQTYVDQCYDDVVAGTDELAFALCDAEHTPDATVTTLAGGDARRLEAQTFTHRANQINGTVTDTSGRPLKDISVSPVRVGDPDTSVFWAASTRSTGAFRTAQFPDGQYDLVAEDRSGRWATQWFDGAPSRDGATTFDIVGEVVTGIVVELKSRAEIDATITPGTGRAKVAVDVTRAATGSKPTGSVTVRWGTVKKTFSLVAGRGSATLSGLPPGRRQITVTYAGTPATAAASATFLTTVK